MLGIAYALETCMLTVPQVSTLERLDWLDGPVWWHDLRSGTREVLFRSGYIREARSVKCGTAGHSHPGYIVITALGKRALASKRKQP